MKSRGEAIYNWIMERLDDGYTVYAQTHWKIFKITAKHRDLVREKNGHCEVARGKNWDSINFCKITARKEG